eukprot:6260168-Prymnesium_polylepis.1
MATLRRDGDTPEEELLRRHVILAVRRLGLLRLVEPLGRARQRGSRRLVVLRVDRLEAAAEADIAPPEGQEAVETGNLAEDALHGLSRPPELIRPAQPEDGERHDGRPDGAGIVEEHRWTSRGTPQPGRRQTGSAEWAHRHGSSGRLLRSRLLFGGPPPVRSRPRHRYMDGADRQEHLHQRERHERGAHEEAGGAGPARGIDAEQALAVAGAVEVAVARVDVRRVEQRVEGYREHQRRKHALRGEAHRQRVLDATRVLAQHAAHQNAPRRRLQQALGQALARRDSSVL